MPGVAVLNYKDGVGKTTFTRELAAALARRGRRSLAVDMDRRQVTVNRTRCHPR